MDERERERLAHLKLIQGLNADGCRSSAEEGVLHAVRSTPIFSRRVRLALEHGESRSQDAPVHPIFPQYSFLGLREATFGADGEQNRSRPADTDDQDMVYANINAPWSAFICGSQGGGKSHTLSCLLETALSESDAGVLPNPLAGIMFHYDNFTSPESTQVCEAAYLCSQGIPVRVLVSPVNLANMQRLYANLPGLPAHAPKPRVEPLYFREQQLNTSNMLVLMAVDDDARVPLYLAVIKSILKEMAVKREGAPGVDYHEFKKKVAEQKFTREQSVPLNMRLQLLEDFLKESADIESIWNFDKGTLTIVDLSCPFINQNDACALFTICLRLFMEGRSRAGRIVALDEAHKFLTQSSEATAFTEQLISAIRQERHIATRILIATQEPTLSPKLLELCNVSIVHRFSSPAWLDTLKKHLAGLGRVRNNQSAADELFRTIVALRTGQALLFSPEAMLDVMDTESDFFPSWQAIRPLRDTFIQIRVRQRVTADGGQTILASDSTPAARPSGGQSQGSLGGSGSDETGDRGSQAGRSRPPGSSDASSVGSVSGSSESSDGADVLNKKPNNDGRAPRDVVVPLKPQLKTSTVQGAATPASRSSGPVPPKSQPQASKAQAGATSTPRPSAPVPSPPITSAGTRAPSSRPNQAKITKKTAIDWSLVQKCISRHVVHVLDRDTTHLDFGVIRRAVEKDLRFANCLLTKSDGSGAIIKDTSTEYFRDRGIPYPKWLGW